MVEWNGENEKIDDNKEEKLANTAKIWRSEEKMGKVEKVM